MATATLDCPTYVSSHSADVILSDVRPVKLRADALRCINVLLDELLWAILSAARALATERLNTGLRRVLPTALGKEALLEAEVELRAYLEHASPTSPLPSVEEDEFHLAYAFDLLRIKCEAYATLNDQDEDTDAEARLHQRMTGVPTPRGALIAPAALYLTAVLECVCEHILTNVGRVAARDSSRTYATVQDLFVALCEDDSMYALFKTMKVYTQIEQMTKAPTRGKSFSQSSDRPPSRTTTTSPTATPDGHRPSLTPTRSRQSTESMQRPNGQSKHASTASSPPPPPPARSSFERARALKAALLPSTRSSSEKDGSNEDAGMASPPYAHMNGKTDSVLSEGTKQAWRAYNETMRSDSPSDDGSQDFDELMRSNSTVKMSLTPDRLKSMEMYNREKSARGKAKKQPSKLASDVSYPADEPSSPLTVPVTPRSAPLGSRRPSAQVESIQEDEEEGSTTPVQVTRMQQAGLGSGGPPSASPRMRSISVSAASTTPSPSHSNGKSALPTAPSAVSLRATHSAGPGPGPVPSQRRHPLVVNTGNGMPARKRGVARNRESLDLDDIMNGSDDEPTAPSTNAPSLNDGEPRRGAFASPASTHARSVTSTPTKAAGGVSRTTRDLMDFLEQGPPDMLPTNSPLDGRPSAPQDSSSSTGKGSKGGRLAGMMRRLTRGASVEHLKARVREDAANRPPLPPSAFPKSINVGPPMLAGAQRVNVGNAVVIASRPPRPPPSLPISPPASPMRSSMDEERDLPGSMPPASSTRSPKMEHTSSGGTLSPNDTLSPIGTLSPTGSLSPNGTVSGTSIGRKLSVTRKAVPVWDKDAVAGPPRSPREETHAMKTSPPNGTLHTPEPSTGSHIDGGRSRTRNRSLREPQQPMVVVDPSHTAPQLSRTPTSESPVLGHRSSAARLRPSPSPVENNPGLGLSLLADSRTTPSPSPSRSRGSSPPRSRKSSVASSSRAFTERTDAERAPAAHVQASLAAVPSPSINLSSPSLYSSATPPLPPAKMTTPSSSAPIVQPPAITRSQDKPRMVNEHAQPAAADMVELRQLMDRATTADECRLLVDMFLLRAGGRVPNSVPTDFSMSYPSPATSDDLHAGVSGAPSATERNLVELLLGELPAPVATVQQDVDSLPSPKSARRQAIPITVEV